MQSVATDRVVSVCPSVITMSLTKVAEPIVMPFGFLTWVGPRNHVLDEGSDPLIQTGNFEGENLRPIVKYRDCLP